MRCSFRGWYGAIIASTLTLVIGCSDAPAAPESPAQASNSALKERDEDEDSGSRIPFTALRLFFEFNSTANDLGVQLLLDAEEWKRVTAFDPGRRKIFEITANGRLQELGLTELVFESAEPSPAEVLALFPPGNYRFEGRTLGKDMLVGTAALSHALPPAPSFTPSQGELVDRNNVVINWNPIPGIASYQVIVENADLGVTMIVDLKPPVTSLQVPSAFLRPNTAYQAEVLAIASNGNRTITEGRFVTKP